MIWSAVLLYIGGIALVLAEFLVPGGICGGLGALFVLTSCALGCYAVPDHAFFIILGEVLGLVVSVIVGVNVFPKSRAGKALILKSSQVAEAGWVAAKSDEALVGECGEVLTALRPAGTIKVNGKRVDAVSDGQFIDKGTTVRVIEVHGSRVVVEEAETQ